MHWRSIGKKQRWYYVGESGSGNVLDKEVMMMHWRKRQW